MAKSIDPLANLRGAAPCPANWSEMAGDERVRHCALCQLNVYNFAELTRPEVERLLTQSEGRVCGRLYRRADGTVITRDCPTGLQALRQRSMKAASALFAAVLSLVGAASANAANDSRGHSTAVMKIRRSPAGAKTAIRGVVENDGAGLSGVAVKLSSPALDVVRIAMTDGDGAFAFTDIPPGKYDLHAELTGLEPAILRNAAVGAHQTAFVKMSMPVLVTGIIVTTRAVPVDPMRVKSGMAMKMQSSDVDKLPLP
jgi:hypothetical protein